VNDIQGNLIVTNQQVANIRADLVSF